MGMGELRPHHTKTGMEKDREGQRNRKTASGREGEPDDRGGQLQTVV